MKKTVLVIFGGKSSEHEVSCVSAASVVRNLDPQKYKVITIGITKEGRWLLYCGGPDDMENGNWQNHKCLPAHLSPSSDEGGIVVLNKHNEFGGNFDFIKVDVIFPVLHGAYGEDGCIQGLFELANIPYVGSGVLSSACCMDKGFANAILEKENIPHAKWLVVDENFSDRIEEIESYIGYPMFVKPCNAGSSVGVSKAKSREELITAYDNAKKHDRRVLIEEFIDGREIECAVMGNHDPVASCLGEIIPDREFYDYDSKYSKDSKTQLIVGADLPEETTKKIQEYAIRAHKALLCKGLSRVDFFVHKTTGKIYLNEVNTIPGFTSISMYPKLFMAGGLTYGEILDKLISFALD